MIAQPVEVDPSEIISKGALILKIPVDAEAVGKMVRHLQFLNLWRNRRSLTSLKDMAQMAVLHVLDSLTVFKVVKAEAYLRVLDAGSGAGFPGVVMRIADDSMNLTLMDGDPAKIVFLKHLIRHLALEGVAFLNTRLDSLLAADDCFSFDLVVSRALSSKPAVIQRLSSLVSPGGSLVRMLGPSPASHQFLPQNLRLADAWEGTLPFSSHFRRVIRYERA